jgi:hypothetical protein
MQQQQYSEEEIFAINLEQYECFTFTDDDGNTIYLYDRIREDQEDH